MAKKARLAPNQRGFKKLQCKYCDNVSERVDINTTAVTCWQCTQRLVNGEILEIRK
jgi:ribosomal protein S27E